MLIIPGPQTQQRRIKVAMPPTSTPPLLPLAIVSVSGASFHAGSGQVTVTLAVAAGYELDDPQDADPTQWFVTFNHLLYRGIAIDFGGGASLTLEVTQYGGATGSNWISYAADPADIRDTQGRVLGVVNEYPW